MTQPLPLAGIKVLDMTHVQAGPACCQQLAWMGADVLKVERTTAGDVTRSQLRDIPDVDALYFTMLNSNKRSLAIDTKKPEGLAVMEELIRRADVLVENFAPGAMDRMGLSWEHVHELNPRLVYGTVKGFNDNSRFNDLKVYDNVAQAAGGSASTTGFWDGPPTISGAALGDSNTGMHLAIGILSALIGRDKTGKGQRVSVSMQDAVLNLCRVKLRDQQRLENVGYLEEYPQYPNGTFTDVVPRGGNAGGGGQPGWILKCKGWEEDPNAYIYFTIQEQNWARTAEAIGKPSGPTIRTTPPPARVRRASSTSLTRSRSGWPIRPSTRPSTSCASTRFRSPSRSVLADMQTAGKIRHIGLSEVTVEQIRAAHEVAPIVSVQNLYNVADRTAEPVLEYCEQRGLAFIPWFPIANRALAAPDGPLGRLGAEIGATPAQLALAWLLQRSPVMLPIPGTSSIEHLEENVAAASVLLTDEQVSRMNVWR